MSEGIIWEDRNTMDFEPWKQKHIDTLIDMDNDPECDFMLFQALELYMDVI